MPRTALLLLAAVAAPALAQSTITVASHADRYPSVQVAVGDLDLTSADGQRRLDDRLMRAAAQVCTMTRLRDLSESRLVDRCRADTLARARAARGTSIAD
ncbi:UrcA family protein [Sandarakinorhabdus oryzae]|uniref:UrcA family protein n=1 Tax=Sandarakinorhabdus oryzae TaxID=2675220 RepID=UPI0012E277F0|nr:UrcA family protein [Sandarakinorhabdus oryzae]